MGWPRFHGFSMIAKDLIPEVGTNSFAIMKCLLKSMPGSHIRLRGLISPRVPGAFLADRIIVGQNPTALYFLDLRVLMPGFGCCVTGGSRLGLAA